MTQKQDRLDKGDLYYYITYFKESGRCDMIKRYHPFRVKTVDSDLIWLGHHNDYDGFVADILVQKPHWHTSKQEAVNYLNQRREEEITKLKQQINELNSIDFSDNTQWIK